MKGKRLLALFLTVCMVATMLPAVTLPASAAGGDTDISDMNALDALGIDTSQLPDGVDLNSTDNPYGRNDVTVNPVYELFQTGTTSSTIWGYDKAVGKSWDVFQNDQSKVLTGISTGTYAMTASASGNFTKSTSALTGQVVTVAAGSLSPGGGLYLYFSNPAGNTQGSAKELLGTSATIGNYGSKMTENFSQDSYLLANYLKVSAGDYDGDGVDEVAVYVPQQGSSRVEIYDLQIDSTFNSGNADTYFENVSHWAKAWTYYFNENPYVSNMVSLTSGDFNRDGVDDLGLTWGYYYGSSNYTNSQAVVLCGSKTAMLQKNMTIDLKYNTSQIVRAAFTFGDVDGDNVNDLILGGQLNSDIAGRNLNTRFVAFYTYDGTTDTFLQSVAQNFDLFAKKDGTYVYKVMATHNDRFYSLPTNVANISAINMLGVGRAASIYIDSLIIEYGNDGLNITAALDQNPDFNTKINEYYPNWIRTYGGRFYSEYNVVAADYLGKGKQTLDVTLNYSSEAYDQALVFTPYDWQNWWITCILHSWTTVSGGAKVTKGAETVRVSVEGELTEVKDSTTGAVTGYDFDVNTKTRPVDRSVSYCKLNCDQDTSFIKYTNEHGVCYSDPEVLAVLASTPYFSDLDRDDLSGSSMESSTSYGKTTGTGTEHTSSHTLSIGLYVSFQHDFEVFGVKVAGMETELAYSHGFTWETTETSTTEMSVTYSTIVGQDSVVFYSIPMEYYVFDSYVPIIDESTGEVTGYDTQKMSVNIPHTAATVVLALDKYEKIRKDYPELPQIAGKVLDHTVGEPSTYPSSTAGYSNVKVYNGSWSGMQYSAYGSSSEQSISITEENSSGFSNTDSIEFKIGAGPGDFIFGVSAGYEYGYGKATITSEGSTYTGCIYDLPSEAEEFGYYFAWKLFAYTFDVDGKTIPVVSYLVKDVTAPPALPTDFAQDNTLTTDDTNALTWSYPSSCAVSGFQIYRYYEFPDGSGSYELGFVNASDVSFITKNEDGSTMRHYQFLDGGLADYTQYSYQIQAIRSAVPRMSIQSGILTARTKPDKGYPTITLDGVTANVTNAYDDETGAVISSVTDYSLLVYPDTSSTVSVSVAENYDEEPRYQWQKLTDDGWVNLDGAIKSSYIFKNSGQSTAGEYRCRVNVIYEDADVGQVYYISSYSDVFTLNYSMRTPMLVPDSFVTSISNQTVSLMLKSAHSNHTFAPSGNVNFLVRGADYLASYTVALGTADANYQSTATLDLGGTDRDGDNIAVNLPKGVYEITAVYTGSRVFGSLVLSQTVYYSSGNESGYLLNADSAYVFGSGITPQLMSVGVSAGKVTAEEVTSGVTYKVYQTSPVVVTGYLTYSFFDLFTIRIPYLYVQFQSVEHPEFVSGSTVTARKVGKFELRAYVDNALAASKDIIVTQRSVTVGIKQKLEGVSGNSSLTQPTYDNLEVTSTTGLVYGNTLANLGLAVNSYNTAGTQVTIDPKLDPGLYTIVGAPGSSVSEDYYNYNFTFTSSTYTLTGPKYDFTLTSAKYGSDNAIVGTVAITKPTVTDSTGAVIDAATTATDNDWYRETAFAGGTDISLQAAPQAGYRVKSWTVTTVNPITQIPTTTTTDPNDHSNYFHFQTTAEKTFVTTEFEITRNHLYFQSANSGKSDGIVTAVGNSIQSGALVQQGAAYTFLATPAPNYHFVEWTISGDQNGNFQGDYDPATGTSTASVTMGKVDTVLSAVFARDSYTLRLPVNLQATYLKDDGFGNMVETTSIGTGIEVDKVTASILGDTLVKVAPRTGYSLLDGAVWQANGVVVTPDAGGKSYTFEMDSEMTIEVGTNQNIYSVSVSVSQPASTTHNAVVVRANNAVTDFSETRSVAGGTALSFTAVPAWGYVFDHWMVDGAASAETSKVLTIAALGAATTVQAVFVANPDAYTVNVSNNPGGSLTYTITYTGSGYSGAPADAPVTASGTSITVYKGDTLTLTAHPSSNYMLRSWTDGDVVNETPENTLTLADLAESKTISARFIPMSFSVVSYTAGAGGTITSATTDGVPFASGASIGNGTKVIITAVPNTVPDAAMMISYWTVDGETVKTADDTDFIGEVLTIESLSASSTAQINVYFKALSERTVNFSLTNASVNRTYSPATYTGKTASTATADYVLDGTKAVFTAVPDDGYRITSFTVGSSSGTENTDGTWSYTVTQITSDLNVAVTAAKLYTLTVDAGITNGSIGITTQKEIGRAIAGETITLATITPDLDFTFGSWSYNSTTVDGTTFAMPAGDTTVSASFTAIDPMSFTYSVYDTNGSEAGGLNGDITAQVARTWAAGGVVTGYPYADDDGSLTVHRGYTDSYVSWPDSAVTFMAAPETGYAVKYWYVNDVQVPTDSAVYEIGPNTLTMTAAQSTADSLKIQVQYEPIGKEITYSAVNSYGTITSAVLKSVFGETKAIKNNDILTIDGTITFTSAPNTGYQVEGWYVNGQKQAGETANTYVYTAKAEVGAAIAVKFERMSYTVTYGGANGTVTASIGANAVDASPAAVVGDSTVTFTAAAKPGYAFTGWTVNGAASGEASSTLSLTITADTTVAAVFATEANCTVTYGVTGSVGGTVSAVRNGTAFTSGSLAAADDVITFTAVPETVAGGGTNNYKVASWTVGDDTVTTTGTTRQITVSASTLVFVTFERYDWVVNYGVGGDNGSVSAKVDSAAVSSSSRIATGKTVTFTAVPDEGYQVKSWTVRDEAKDETTNTEDTVFALDDLSADTDVTVTFEEVPYYTVTITTSGIGYGSVSAAVNSDEAIPDATTVSVPRHGTLTLTALRYNEDNAFNGWTVASKPPCSVSRDGIVLTLSNVTGETEVDAAFVPATMIEISASEDDGHGTLNYTTAQAGYLSAGLMSTIELSTATSVQITSGMDVVITAAPDTNDNGYMVCTWYVNGTAQTELSKTLTLHEVREDTRISVTFESLVYYSIPISGEDSNGGYYTVSLNEMIPADNGTSNDIPDEDGTVIRDRGTVTFTVSPDNGCYFTDLTICGLDCLTDSASPEGTVENVVSSVKNDDGSYTVTVSNVKNKLVDPETYTYIRCVMPVLAVTTPVNGTITVTYPDGTGGTVTALSEDELPVGTELTVTATPSSGYFLESWGGEAAGQNGTVINLTVGESKTFAISAVFDQPVITIAPGDNGGITASYTDSGSVTHPVVSGDKVPVGTVLSVVGTPNASYSLTWGGAALGKKGSPISLTVPANDITISATFNYAAGGGISGGGAIIPEQVTTKTTKSNGITTIVVTVDADPTVSGQTASTNLQEFSDDILEQLESAEGSVSGTFTSNVFVDATASGSVTKTTVEIPVATIRSIVDDTSATMTIQTNSAQIVLDQAALEAIADGASGSTVTITAEQVDVSTLSQQVQDKIGDAYVIDLTVTSSGSTISDLAGGKATVRIPVPSSMDGENMRVVYLADDGTLTEVTGSVVTVDGKQYFEFTTGHFSRYALVVAPPFTDVAVSDWFYSSVDYVYTNGLMNGMSDTLFSPNGTTTRAMLVTVLWRMAGEPASVADSGFSDVAAGTWYSAAVSWAAEKGIVSGIGGGLFAPNDSVTREQLAVIFRNYARVSGADVSALGDVAQFTDSAAISSWASDAVKWAVSVGLISGKGSGFLDPTGTATRAEIATILMRFSKI